MAATHVVAGMMFQCVLEGSISMQDMEIERRPYHKNCSCALHKSKGGASVFTYACPQQRNISFPKKQSWIDSSLWMQASTPTNSTRSKFSNSQHSFLGDTLSSTGNRETVNGAHSMSVSHKRSIDGLRHQNSRSNFEEFGACGRIYFF